MEEPSVNLWWTIGLTLSSGIIATIISTVYYRLHEARTARLGTLTRLLANRYDLKGDEFSRALNEIFVIFQKSESVMVALSNFHKATTGEGTSNEDELLILIKAMCDNVRISHKQVNDSFFLKPFNTRDSCQKK